MRWLSRLVTIVVIVAVVFGLASLIRSAMPATKIGQHFAAWALFRDGSKLAQGSPVMIAGVRIGEVRTIRLEGDFVHVDMLLLDSTNIPADSWITKRAESAFGDNYLEIIPTTAEEGAPNARRLQSGERIVHVIEGSSTDTVLRTISRAMPKIDDGLDTVHDLALRGRKWASGPLEDAVNGADHWLQAGHIEGPLESADKSMERLESGAASAADSVASARRNERPTFDRIDRGIKSTRDQMASFKRGLHDALAGARDGIDRIDPTVDQMQEVVTAINEGSGADWKGTLGRMVNTPDLGNDVEDVTESLAEGAASLNKFRSWLGMRFEYNVFSRTPRAYATAELAARHDTFFLIELERGPLGDLPDINVGDSPNNPSTTRTITISDTNRFTAEFGKVLLGRYRVRGGIKESTFGMGADVLLDDGVLRFSADLFGSWTTTPRLKIAGALEVFHSVYLLAGVDDALNSPGYLPIVTGNTPVPTEFNSVRYGRDYFLGATLQFTDADLATLLRVYGALIVGLL